MAADPPFSTFLVAFGFSTREKNQNKNFWKVLHSSLISSWIEV